MIILKVSLTTFSIAAPRSSRMTMAWNKFQILKKFWRSTQHVVFIAEINLVWPLTPRHMVEVDMTRLSPWTRVKVEVWLLAGSCCFLKTEMKNSFTSSCSTSVKCCSLGMKNAWHSDMKLLQLTAKKCFLWIPLNTNSLDLTSIQRSVF